MWLTQLLERNRHCRPDRTALMDEERSVTWAELRNRTLQLAHGLADLGSAGATGRPCCPRT